MAKLRTIVTALIVCALAVLPVASAGAAVRMAASMGPVSIGISEAEQSSMHGDCENHATIAIAEKDDAPVPSSGDSGQCPGSGCSKCLCLGLAVTGVLAIGPATPSFAFAAIPSGWATPGLLAPSVLPPSPPPRV